MTQQAAPAAAPIVAAVLDKTAESTKVEAPIVEADELDAASKAARRSQKAAAWKREQQQKADINGHKAIMAQAENHRLKQELTQIREFQNSLKADPYKALKSLGLNDKDITARYVQEGSVEALVASVKEELAQERAKREALENGITSEKAEARERASEKLFINEIKVKGVEKYPNVSKLPNRILIDQANLLLQRLSNKIDPQTGQKVDIRGVTWHDIGAFLEEEFAPKKSKVVPPETSTDVDGVADKKTPGKKPFPTLTDKLASEKFVLPADFEKLSNKAQNKILADQMKARGIAK